MLSSRPWERVGRFAAGCAQSRALHLQPWETPPLGIRDIEAALNAPEDAKRIGDAARLLQKLLRLGLSKFEPDPLQAIAAAEQRRDAS